MKKNLIRNILTSICITMFIVTILLLIDGLVFHNIRENAILNSAETQLNEQEGLKETLEEDIKNYTSENGVIEYYKKTARIYFSSSEMVYYEIAYSLVVSVIIGSIVGYLRTIMESRQDKTAVLKKAVLIYLVGLAVVGAFVGIIDIVRDGFDIEAIGLYSLIYTVVYVIYFSIKMRIDNNKKSKLNELVNTYKDSKK